MSHVSADSAWGTASLGWAIALAVGAIGVSYQIHIGAGFEGHAGARLEHAIDLLLFGVVNPALAFWGWTAVARARRAGHLLDAVNVASPDAIIHLGPDGRVRFWSRQAEVLLGYSAGHANGRALWELLGPEGEPLWLQLRDRVRRSGLVQVMEDYGGVADFEALAFWQDDTNNVASIWGRAVGGGRVAHLLRLGSDSATSTHSLSSNDVLVAQKLEVDGLSYFDAQLTQTTLAIATAQTIGILAQNTTAAANGVQQYSPMLSQQGYGWETTGGTSQLAEWATQVRPEQGATLTSDLVWWSKIGAAAYAERMKLTTGGVLNASAYVAQVAGCAIT